MSEQKDPKDLNEESVSKPTEDTSENNTSETSIDEKTSSETEANSEGEDKKDNISETIEGTSEHDESKTSNNDEVTSESASNSEEKNEGEESLESDNDLAENENSGAKDQDVDEANAEDNEDHDVARRHEIELKDYHAMSLDELVLELESLVKKEKVQSIKDHVNNIKIEFDKKFNDIIEEKKEEFIAEGGNIIDFHYSSPVKKNFNTIYFNYREKRDQYYSQLKKNLNTNLKTRLGIIEELKNMIGSGESMTASFKQFKELQERWKNAGSVPRSDYNTVWNNYHHHIERFYDFLHLDREFRDMDFKYNLDQKLKIINRAEELTQEEDINRAFRELQLLHKMWKEELGPVAREFRDEIWEKFSEATRLIHDKRQAHFEKLDEKREENLKVKLEIIEQIQKLTESKITQHKDAQERIKNVNKLRDLFFKAGSVPRQKQDATWDAFRKATREFNKNKNDFYKDLKAEQYENLEKKKELIKIAEEHKDSDDFKTTTPLMKKIQNDWKKIGHVPRKDSDKIWKQFKSACNHYFDRFHANKNNEDNEEMKAFNQKRELIQKLKRIDISKTDAELMKYQNRLQNLEESDDSQRIYKEQTFLRKKIDDTKSELQQLENNLQFFSVDADRNNPLVKEVYSNIDKLKDDLEMWKTKLKKIKEL